MTKHALPPEMNFSIVFERNAEAYYAGKRKIINQGGTSSSKTWSILQLLTLIAIGTENPLLISVMSESVPHLKQGAIRDFRKILGKAFDENRFHETDHLYDFGLGQLEFFSADTDKAHGPRRDILFCNEVNNFGRTTADAAAIRTAKCIFYDYNPTAEFWLMDEIGKKDTAYIESTYQDAKIFLPPALIADIESRKDKDANWWRVYGEGKVGSAQGLAHPNFLLIDEMPEVGSGQEVYGLDFGFTNDPTVLVRNIIIGDNLYSDQLIYETGMINKDILQRMESTGVKKNYDEVIADCSDPKSIEEISLGGFNVLPCMKGPDSVIFGVQTVNKYRQHWTKRSVQSIKEQRGYGYVQDKDGKYTNKLIDSRNHAMDARRYAVAYKANAIPLQIF